MPDSAVLGEVGLGFKYAQVRLGPARLTHCMRWLGLARRALDTALDRAERRELFGAPLRSLGLAQELIAQSVIDVETSDAIIAKAAALIAVDPKAGSALSSVAKVNCSEAIYRVMDRAVQLCGGDGVSDALPLAQYLAEVRPFRIYDGSTETHKWAIARRASSRRRAAVAAGEPFLADVDAALTGSQVAVSPTMQADGVEVVGHRRRGSPARAAAAAGPRCGHRVPRRARAGHRPAVVGADRRGPVQRHLPDPTGRRRVRAAPRPAPAAAALDP